MNDELRDQIARLDPVSAGVPVESVTAPASRERLEHIMSTPTTTTRRPTGGLPRRLVSAAAAAVLVTAAAVGFALTRGAGSGPPLELSLGNPAVMASCLPVSAELLADMPMAMSGTVTGIGDDAVTLRIDHWYRGGEAAEVTLRAIDDLNLMVSVIEFQLGEEYLITATNGAVNYCGFSGPATPELQRLFEEAFAG